MFKVFTIAITMFIFNTVTVMLLIPYMYMGYHYRFTSFALGVLVTAITFVVSEKVMKKIERKMKE